MFMTVIGIALLLVSGESTVRTHCNLVRVGHPRWSHSKAFVLNRYIDEDGCLVTKRLHAVYQETPSYIRAFVGDYCSYAGEESIINPKTKTFSMRTKNISLGCIALCDELCVYKPLPGDMSKTDYRKYVHVHAYLYGFINNLVEDWCVDVDRKNRGNGITVMDEILKSFTSFVIPPPVEV